MSETLDLLNASGLGLALVIVLGLIMGSFFNVLILRLPDEVTLMDRSRCPKCKKKIPWYLNIPVFSYLWLRGKCQKCKRPISIQYPLVELGTASMYAWLFHHYGLGTQFLAYAIFTSLLIVISVIDLYHQIIPDELSLPGIVIGVLASLITGDHTWWSSLLGAVLGGGIFLAIAYLYERLAKREGLGGGDVKLLAMIGAWLGLESIFPVVLISSFCGSAIGLTIMATQKKDIKTAIPFGPYLAVSAIIYLFWGDLFYALLFSDLT